MRPAESAICGHLATVDTFPLPVNYAILCIFSHAIRVDLKVRQLALRSQRPMHRLSVLIVDNSTDVRKELESVLLDLDPLHARRSASTPEEAVSVGEAFRPDVIIYDLPLAGSEDAQVIRHLKAILPATRIVAISLYDHYGAAALEAGADEFVSKTASRSTFLAALERQCVAAGRQSE